MASLPKTTARTAQNIPHKRKATTRGRQTNQREYNPRLGNPANKGQWHHITRDEFHGLDDARFRRWHHVGELLYSDKGVEAAEACRRCAEEDEDCIVYAEGIKVACGKTPSRCAACLPLNRPCSAVRTEDLDMVNKAARDDDESSKSRGCCQAFGLRVVELEKEVAELGRIVRSMRSEVEGSGFHR